MGWNTVKNLKSDLFKNIDEGDYMYLVHSYYAENCKESIATSDYEIEQSLRTDQKLNLELWEKTNCLYKQ